MNDNNHEDIFANRTTYGISLGDWCINHFRREYTRHRGRECPPITGKSNYERMLRLLDILLSPELDAAGETTDAEREKRALGWFVEIVETYFQSRYQRGCDYGWRHFSTEKVFAYLMCKLDLVERFDLYDTDGSMKESLEIW